MATNIASLHWKRAPRPQPEFEEDYAVARCRLLLIVVAFFGLAGIVHAGEIERRTVTGYGGVPLAVMEAGNRDGPAILFVHGTAQATPVWKKQFADPVLSEAFHLIAFDLRGHGESGKPWDKDAYLADALAGDIKAVVEATTAGKVVLVPWSYGGIVTFAYVRKFGLERVAGINIAASRSAFGPSTRQAEMSGAERAALRERSAAMRSTDLLLRSAAMRNFIGDLTAAPLPENELAEFFAFNMMTPAYVLRVKRSYRPDNRDLAPELRLPVLVTHGDADVLVSVKDAQRSHRMIAGSRLSVYEGVGHMPFYERPERFNRELAEFARLCATAPAPMD
jgi:non-heme chloroperoxidase